MSSIPTTTPDAINKPKVYLTLLPNGIRNGKLQLTLVFTLSLEGTSFKGSPFEHWNDKLRNEVCYKFITGHWIVRFIGPGPGPITHRAMPVDSSYAGHLNPAMWETVFGNVATQDNVKRSAKAATKPLVISHDAAYMHAAFDAHRLDHFRAHYLNAVATEDKAKADIANIAKLSQIVSEQSQSVDIYLRPTFDINSPGVPTMAQMIQARKDAKDFWATARAGLTTVQLTLIDPYFSWAIDILEKGEQLREIGYYALYMHCVNRTKPHDPHDATLLAIKTKATDNNKGLNPCAVSPEALAQAERVIDFLLFKEPKKPQQTTRVSLTPTFHETLSMINRYPAMLRPLGLALDLEVDNGFRVPVPGTIEILVPPDHSSLFDVVSMKTTCICVPTSPTFPEHFYALSRYENMQRADQITATDGERLLGRSFLWLKATSSEETGSDILFMTVSQDTDGSLQKMYITTSADSRSTEYAPTPDPTRPNSPPSTLPSNRSTGITLLHRGRADRMHTALSNTDLLRSTLGTKEKPESPILFAEDLVLGYRVDVRIKKDKAKASDWFPLCARESRYEIHADLPFTWKPQSDSEKAADEGFVTLGAVTNTTSGDLSHIAFHQSIFSWDGWSLSVPAFFDPVTGGEPSKTEPETRVLPITPSYTLEEGRKLLPLRFDRDYEIRCRAVDIAGNSVPCPPKSGDPGADEGDTTHTDVILPHRMVRQEPIRSPQILLDAPIRRSKTPGDHVDTIILRDRRGLIERVLVAPRETLRMAELHDQFKVRDLPDGAFAGICLNDDGSFPTVAQAYAQGWFNDEGEDSRTSATDPVPPELQDPIFRVDRSVAPPTDCPYFPDPLASHVCLKLNQQSKPEYLDLYPSALTEGWPNTIPARIRVIPGSEGDSVTASKRDLLLDPGDPLRGLASGLVITVPPAMTATLDVSSAWCQKDTDGPAPVVGLAHLHQDAILRAKKDDSASRLPVGDRATKDSAEPTLVSSVYLSKSAKPEQKKKQDDANEARKDAALSALKPEDFIDGTIPAQTPAHRIRIIHAVKQPLSAPDFPKDFDVQRAYGDAAATVSGDEWTADWKSTSKITCRAAWTDCIDDIRNPGPTSVSHHEVAFDISYDERNCIAPSKKHLLRDTRAHKITFSLTATSAFRDYYPHKNTTDGNRDGTDFDHPDHPSCEIIVRSSVRPPAPEIAYIIPAFRWLENFDETTGVYDRVRLTLLRVYLKRPYGVSGDEERLGVVLAQSPLAKTLDNTGASAFVSRMGLDPIAMPALPASISAATRSAFIPRAELTSDMFTTKEIPVSCCLAEVSPHKSKSSPDDGKVDVLPFSVQFAQTRNLHFTDILLHPISQVTQVDGKVKPKIAPSPFVRLALVRYQPYALCGDDQGDDPHISTVVFADFMQLASNRWCAIQRTGREVSLTLSGATNERTGGTDVIIPVESVSGYSSTDESLNSILTIELQHSWHSVDPELSWRPVAKEEPGYTVTFAPAAEVLDNGVTKREVTITLPHTPALFKYRILLMEEEIFSADSYSGTKAVTRLGYFDFIEL